MTSQRLASLCAKVAASSHPGNHPPSPEPTTPSGVTRGNALFDTPPRSAEPAGIEARSHRRKSTERNEWYTESRRKSHEHSRKIMRSRERKAAKRQSRGSCVEPPRDQGHNSDDEQTAASQTRGRSTQQHPLGRPNASRSKAKPKPRVRVRESNVSTNENDIRGIACSPTPGSTDIEPDEPGPTAEATNAESQYTYVLETPGYETLLQFAEERLSTSHSGQPEKEIQKPVAEADHTQPMGTAGQNSLIVLLPPAPIAVGGGWHLEQVRSDSDSQSSESRPPKRTLDAADTTSNVKRLRMTDLENTDTEPETNEEPALSSASPPLTPSAPAITTSAPPFPPLTRASTATTVLDNPLERHTSRSGSLDDLLSRYGSIENLLADSNLPRGPVHARLKAKLIEREIMRDFAKGESKNQGPGSGQTPGGDKAPGEEARDIDQMDYEMAQGNGMDYEMEVEDDPNPSEQTSVPPSQRTYASARSHVSIETEPEPNPPSRAAPSFPSPSRATTERSSRSIRDRVDRTIKNLHAETEAAWAALQDARTEARGRSCIRPRHTNANADTEQSAQLKRHPRQQHSTSALMSSLRRLDPVATARADMVVFNKQCAQENAASFVQSITRQTERRAHCEPVERLPSELLPDDEEERTHASAAAKGKQPTGGRKKKPLARDFAGIQRQILTLAKIHLFAFALVERIYQTRATFMHWAALIHEATWQMEVPELSYAAATIAELEVMVNYIATLRGKVKERVRPIMANSNGFEHRIATQQTIEDNLDIFHDIYPNSFHCTSVRPRKGHYQNSDIGHCLAAALFYGPNSVGVLFPDYFQDMPLTVVAFILAIMQFCIEEWSDGYFVSRDLGAANMLDKYESHLAGLKDLRDVAPGRMFDLQNDWLKYASDYSGASFVRPKPGHAASQRSEMRPDTPPPMMESAAESSSIARCNTRATAKPSSPIPDNDNLADAPCEHIVGPPVAHADSNPFLDDEILALHEELLALENDEPRAPTPHCFRSCSPSPPSVKYNGDGRISARSKGKGRAE